MTSWTSSFARLVGCSAMLLALSCAAGTTRVRAIAQAPAAGPRVRLAVMPPENLTGGKVPLASLHAAVREELTKSGFSFVDDSAMEPFLARHRIRYTGGVSGTTSAAVATDLAAEALLVTTVESYEAEGVPSIAIGMRLVSATDPPVVLWTGMNGASGGDNPGLFERGIIGDAATLQRTLLGTLAQSLADFLARGGAQATTCTGGWRFRPQTSFLAAPHAESRVRVVAVLPFVNETARLKAGESIALEMLRELHATPGYAVVEPGVVREEMLRRRIIFEDGVSLDVARQLLDKLGADVVVGGRVFDHSDAGARAAVVSFSSFMLERGANPLVWATSSYHEGDDGVFFFDLGRVGTAAGLACEMVSEAVDELALGAPTERIEWIQ